MIFDSDANIRGQFFTGFPENVVKNEPMFFNCDLEYAYVHGGDITRAYLDGLPHDWKHEDDVVLDSRVHMLMKGWYPCIPGWHHDDVPRSTPTGQPNYIDPEYRSEHLMGLVNGKIAPTAFACGKVEVSEPDFNKTIYHVWHHEVQEQVEQQKVHVVSAHSGEYIQFNDRAFHTGTKAIENGWRWFTRLSRNTNRTKFITNEMRRQVQVYLEDPTQGW
jgi:hypothetical protein